MTLLLFIYYSIVDLIFFFPLLQGGHDFFFENRHKTEILGWLTKLNSGVTVHFADTISVVLKSKGKVQQVPFLKDEKAGEIAQVSIIVPLQSHSLGLVQFKSKKVSIATGQSRDSQPQMKEPPKMPQVAQFVQQEQRAPVQRKNPAKSAAPPAAKPSAFLSSFITVSHSLTLSCSSQACRCWSTKTDAKAETFPCT